VPLWFVSCAITSCGITFAAFSHGIPSEATMIRKLRSGEYRLYSRKVDPKTGKRKNLGTFGTRAAAEKHERAVQFFKRRG
jgi:hypothetical protein